MAQPMDANYPPDEMAEEEDNKLESLGLRGSNRPVTKFDPRDANPFGKAVIGDTGFKTMDFMPVKGYTPDMDFSKSK